MRELIPINYKNQRIITTKVLAEQFGTGEENIQMNFSRNEKRFIEGKHYYKLEGQALKDFKNSLPTESREPLKFAPKLILWTDRGAARHAKILDTDEAWEIYEELEETYFRVKENTQTLNTSELSPELQMFKSIFDTVAKQQLEQKQMRKDIEDTKNQLQGIREVVAINSNDWKTDCKNLITKIAYKLGGIEHIQDVYKEVYSNLDKRLGTKLQVRLTNKRRRMADEGICKSKRDKLNYISVIEDDKKLIEGYVAIVKELSIRYGVDMN